MKYEHVVAICWMLVGVTIVCIFAAKVSMHAEDQQWSYIVTPAPPHAQRAFFFGK